MVKRIGYLIILCMALLCCGCEAKQSGEENEVTWSKHAFLLEDEDIFFACVPDVGTYDRGAYGSNHEGGYAGASNLADGTFPWESGYGGFTVTTPPSRSDGELWAGRDQKWIEFIFVDGKIGKQLVPEGYNAGGTAGDEIVYPDRIVSEDEKYQLWMSGMKDTEYAGKFCESLMFQSGQIGLQQTESLEKRDKVRFHVGGALLWLDMTVPEGITFHTDEDWLYLGLDDSGESYVEIVYDQEWVEMSYEFAMMDKKEMTDQTYEEAALYGQDDSRKGTRYLFSFIYRKPIYVVVQVPEGDEEMLEVAFDIVRSIKFR